MSEQLRVAIAGVGNCASALVQGVQFYRDVPDDEPIPGLMHTVLGGYHVGDIEFACAFDVDANKVGRDLGEAIFAAPNNTMSFAEVPPTGTEVLRAPTLDGLGQYYRQEIDEASGSPVSVADALRASEADVLVSYLPVGSERAARYYAEQAIEAGVAFVNCMPVFIANDPAWERRFKEAELPIVGDDIKSQVGATIVHRQLAKLLEDRGVRLDRTYQLNFGGNMDFKNMLERERLDSKKLSKTNSVRANVSHDLEDDDIHIGPSDHVPWLADRKWAQIRLEGHGFGDAPMSIELKLEVWDSPNSAGVVVDAVRCCKVAIDHGVGGALVGPSAYFMKSPPVQYPDDIARQMTEDFIEQHTKVGRLAR